MAKKTTTTVELLDDFDGGKADRTVSFSYDGASYEIDLSKRNAAAFEKAMKSYVAAARKVSARRSTSTGRSTTRSSSRKSSRSDLGAIRAWAHDNGIEVSDRGRIAKSVIEAYEAAMG